MSKYFIINEEKEHISREDIQTIEDTRIEKNILSSKKQKEISKSVSTNLENITIKHTSGRVVIIADKEQKNYTNFSDGTEIRLERDYNNLDRTYTQQVFGKVIDSEKIPKGSLVLFHFNSLHDTYKVFNHSMLSGEELSSGVDIYSIPENQCYLYKENEASEWKPCTIFATALRVFKPYEGTLQDIPPTKLPDTLFVTSGKYKGLVVKTLKACDASIIFRNEKGNDETIIRFRPFGDQESDREPEAIAILHELTEQVKNGKLLIGISEKECKKYTL